MMQCFLEIQKALNYNFLGHNVIPNVKTTE